MANFALILSCACAFVACGLVLGEDRTNWDIAKYEEEYMKLGELSDRCQEIEDNPSLISWEKAETALFILMAILVVLVLFVLILLASYCGQRKHIRKMQEKQATIAETRY